MQTPYKKSFDENRIFTLNEPNAPRINPALACEIGLNESIILLQIEFWIATRGISKDGQVWAYMSTRNMKDAIFPFWSHNTINRAIKSLENAGYITIETKYNQLNYDKTRWFALNFDALSELDSICVKASNSGSDTRSSQNDTAPSQNDTTIQKSTKNKNNSVPESKPPPESKPEKKEPVAAAVSKSKDSKTIDTLFDLIPDQNQKPSIKAVISKSIKSGHTEQSIKEAIGYTNNHSNGNHWSKYKAYLGKTIDNGWAEGYLESKKDDVAPDPDVDKKQIFLESRRAMPDHILKYDAENGCSASQQVLSERLKQQKGGTHNEQNFTHR